MNVVDANVSTKGLSGRHFTIAAIQHVDSFGHLEAG